MTLGTIEPQEIKFKVTVLETEIKINKIDSENNENYNNQATLEGTTFQLYNENMQEITKLIIDKSLSTNIKNLPFGTYYLKEIVAGKGYKLDNKLHKIILNQNNPKIKLEIKNTIIKGILELTKNYKENNKIFPEKNIAFNIYDNKGKLFKKITTNELGYASIELPYGTYLIEQKNTTEGYEYIKPFKITIKDKSTLTYNLTNHIIRGKLEITKNLEENNKLLPEKNIIFNIYDYQNNLYKEIVTDELGYTSVELPYGTYLIEQKNTTDGYDYIEPFVITIKDNSTLTYNLTNYKIKVPNTYNNKKNNLIKELLEIIIKGIINAIKIYNNNHFYFKSFNVPTN